ncbi:MULTISPECIES: quinol:cytochrome C oxidoreductase [Nonlabens]|uniref:Quinol:cytochrome c oxidoreductase quinone-binding subunit 2 n=1 Tax=Nonlabens xylanidelens TaxID=191564 RepID=A0A2S6IRT6_9FLAO|nr:quinol:cytochrome C oxidoreductase [Nonlabens xylanidelens]PPK96957.1 quinol:cytochrome c oxidoreductase quinone-binding subunit 2 [Nonlabens xylanidelens]PQJ13651.1 quinol:cytochrome C oxidoreductase [Nonlabens xylanidelens]
MYKVTSKLKIVAFSLIILGALLTAVGFWQVPASQDAVKEMLANEAAHGGGHAIESNEHHDVATVSHGDASHETSVSGEHHGESAHGVSHEDEHAEHVYHQLKNRPWSAVYVAAFFFFMIGLGALAFHAVQKAAQAGWSPVLFRVMEGVSSYILPGGIIMFLLLLATGLGANHIFIWMNEGVDVVGHENYDAIVAGKTGFLNVPFWLFRAGAFLVGWNIYRWNIRKFGLKQDEAEDGDIAWYKKGFKHSAMFLVFFIVTESIMSWDWIMSFDPHWFSTLFGWYVFASMFVSAITAIALVTIFLKSKGYLEFVNDSHIHDLAKFMFGISIFWTYLWFSQFMLIWYSNIPEEVTYFVTRIEDYNIVFFGMVAINFLFPLLILMNSDFKRINWFVVTAGLFIIVGHYLDIYVMVMPSTVGESWFIGFPEIGSFLFFAGLFIFYVFHTISKAPLLVKGDPYVGESKHFHY